jgi:uncharacterized protein (UPF0335 family)
MADLVQHFDRIDELYSEVEATKSKIRSALAEAQDDGYVPAVLRRIVRLSRLSEAERAEFSKRDFLQQKYEAELDPETRAVLAELRAGATFDEAAATTGASRRTVARRAKLAKAVPKNQKVGTASTAEAAASSDDGGLNNSAARKADTNPSHQVATAPQADVTAGDAQARREEDDLEFPGFLRRPMP